MRILLLVAAVIALNFTVKKTNKDEKNFSKIIGQGQMPNVTTDTKGNIHLVFGTSDSIMYSLSKNQGNSFSKPVLVSILPKLAASAMRGPQIAFTSNGLIIMACDKKGDIFSYNKTDRTNWIYTGKINDVDTVAKEGLMGLAGDRGTAYAVWLDLRDQHNKIFGSRSLDGGKTWSKNKMVYTSPDKTVCECCKPSVVVKGKDVFVMFRNWLNGNRDLYLIKSTDAGTTFEQAQKLGNGSWALKGCPMDGGGVVINENGTVQTVWRRENKIYVCEPGRQEQQLGEGRSCTIESVNNNNIYAWTENGEVIVLKSNGIRESFGKGSLPIIKAVSNDMAICVWEKEKQIHASLVKM